MTRPVLLTCALSLSGCGFGASLFGPSCNSSSVDQALQAVASAPDETKGTLLMAGLDQACSGTSLEAAYRASPEMKQALMAAAIETDPSAWNTACPAGSSVLEKMAVATNADQPGVVFDACQLDRLGLDRATVDAWGSETMARVVALGYAQTLNPSQHGQVLAILKAPPAAAP